MSDPTEALRAVNAGADSFLTKPYKDDFLLRRLRQVVENQRLGQQRADGDGVRVVFGGEEFVLHAQQRQVVELLLSAYEDAVAKQRELARLNRELNHSLDVIKALQENYLAALDDSADAMVDISASNEGALLVNVSQTEVQFEDLQITLGGTPGTLLNWLIGLFQDTIANLLEDEFNKQMEEMVGGLTETLAGALDAPIEIPLDGFVPGNDPVLLKLSMLFDKAYFTDAGADLNIRMSVTADNVVGIENPGSLGRGGCLGADDTKFVFDLANPSPLELAAHLDLANQAIYSLWANGGLHLHVTSEALEEMGTDVGKYGVSDLILDTAPLLPPVITSCNADGSLTAQIGDFYLEADLDMLGVPADLHMYLSLALDADLAVVEGELGPEVALAIEEPQYVIVEIVSVNEEWKGKEHVLVGLLTDTLIPHLLDSFKEKPISFALPTINLGGLLPAKEGEPEEPGALDGKELLIDLSSLNLVSSYIHIQGGIKVQDVPEPPPEEEPTQ